MDKGLLLVYNQRPGGKRVDIGPDIATGKECVDPWHRLFIERDKARDVICSFDDPPDLGDFGENPPGRLFLHFS